MKVAIYILVSLFIIACIVAGSYAYRYYTAQVSGKVEAQQQIQSAESRISSYNYFFDLKAAIDSYDTALKALDDNLKQVTSEGERERILATIAGLKGQQARAINEYNASAKKSYTIGQFRDWQLPYQIDSK